MHIRTHTHTHTRTPTHLSSRPQMVLHVCGMLTVLTSFSSTLDTAVPSTLSRSILTNPWRVLGQVTPPPTFGTALSAFLDRGPALSSRKWYSDPLCVCVYVCVCVCVCTYMSTFIYCGRMCFGLPTAISKGIPHTKGSECIVVYCSIVHAQKHDSSGEDRCVSDDDQETSVSEPAPAITTVKAPLLTFSAHKGRIFCNCTHAIATLLSPNACVFVCVYRVLCSTPTANFIAIH